VTRTTDTRHRYNIRQRDPLGNYLWVPPMYTIFFFVGLEMPDRQFPQVFNWNMIGLSFSGSRYTAWISSFILYSHHITVAVNDWDRISRWFLRVTIIIVKCSERSKRLSNRTAVVEKTHFWHRYWCACKHVCRQRFYYVDPTNSARPTTGVRPYDRNLTIIIVLIY